MEASWVLNKGHSTEVRLAVAPFRGGHMVGPIGAVTPIYRHHASVSSSPFEGQMYGSVCAGSHPLGQL